MASSSGLRHSATARSSGWAGPTARLGRSGVDACPATTSALTRSSGRTTPSRSTHHRRGCGHGWCRWVGDGDSGTPPVGSTGCSSPPMGRAPKRSCRSCSTSPSATASSTGRPKRSARSSWKDSRRSATSFSTRGTTFRPAGPSATARGSTSRGPSSSMTWATDALASFSAAGHVSDPGGSEPSTRRWWCPPTSSCHARCSAA